jgi:enamine deaminase RidA (YjgF/YER057c/UK114 family)
MTLTRVPSTSPFAPVIGFSAAVRAGDWIFVSGMTAVTADGDVVGGDDPYAQAREALRRVEEALQQADASLEAVVQTRIYLTSAEHASAVGRAHGEAFADARPATAMLVTELLNPKMRVEVEAIAYVGGTSAGH